MAKRLFESVSNDVSSISKGSQPEEIRKTTKEAGEDSRKLLFEEMESDIEKIAPSLVDICEKVLEEKPDIIIFLDKSARIFAGPIKKYLGDATEGRKDVLPKFYFYNNNTINQEITKYRCGVFCAQVDLELEKRIADEFKILTGRKIFIIDENYSSGKVLRMWVEVNNVLNGIDPETQIHFFALTRDEQEREYKERVKFFKNETLEKATAEPNFKFTIYDTVKTNVFSKFYHFQYVQDHDLNGSVVSEGVNNSLKRSRISINSPLDSSSAKTNDTHHGTYEEREEANARIFEAVKIAKQRTYEKMKEFSNNK